jgi:hypothetical protein
VENRSWNALIDAGAAKRWRRLAVNNSIARVAQASKQIAHDKVKIREIRVQLTSLEKRLEQGSASHADTVKQLYESLA